MLSFVVTKVTNDFTSRIGIYLFVRFTPPFLWTLKKSPYGFLVCAYWS